MPSDKLLMLVDGHSLVHRAFHALPQDLSTSDGELTNAVFGFSTMLLKSIDEIQPSNVVLAFDRPVPTFRHVAYAEYKATRPPTPRPLSVQFARVREIAGAMNIPICELDGYEADDVLGTLSLQARDRQIPTVIVTGDLDALQLVDEDVNVLTSRGRFQDTVLYDLEAVRERYGFEPEKLPDYKALVGDTSDNIPGVRGIGDKGAKTLIQKFGSLEGVYDHLDELPAKQRDALGGHRDQAFKSRELARIDRNAPVALSLTGWEIDRSRLLHLFSELEFHSLIGRFQVTRAGTSPQPVAAAPVGRQAQQLSMFGADEVAPAPDTTSPGMAALRNGAPEVATRAVKAEDDLDALVAQLEEAPRFAVDTETTSTDPLHARLVGLSFAIQPEEAWYVPVGHREGTQLPVDRVLERLRPVLESPEHQKVGHNLKYDYEILRGAGVAMRGLDFDTMIAAYLVKPTGRERSLSTLALSRLGVEMTPIEALIGQGKSQITMDLVDVDTVAAYAGADAEVTLRLRDILEKELEARQLTKLFREVEMPLVPVLADMERVGISVDPAVLQSMSRDMGEIIGRLEGRIYEEAGHRFNINSTQQMAQVLFQELKLPAGRRTKTGHSTDNEVLEGLRGKHGIVDDILEYRQLIKLKNTYVDALPSLVDPHDGRVHTDFNQAATATGRLSSSNPNLQNIPIRGEVGRKIRRAFVPSRPENLLLAADYSQIELRILASVSGDERLLHAFRSGEDVHRATASAVFGVPLEQVTPDQRRIAKVVNFGIIYGIGEQRLAHETGISRSEAGNFIANYNRTYAGVKSYMDSMRKQAAFNGFVSTILHRRRDIPDIHSEHPGVRQAAERAAINMPIQGTAADIIKIAMVQLHDQLRARHPESQMLLQVHDELVFEVPSRELEEVSRLVRRTMEGAFELEVPLEVEMKVGRDWYDMTPLDVAA